MPYEYLLSLTILLFIALILKVKYKIKIFKSLKETVFFYLIIFFVGTIWDNFAVWRGHWFYPGKGILGIFIGLIPLEDYVFAIITSYTVLVLHKVIQKMSSD